MRARAAALALLAACGPPPEPDPLPRVVAAAPSGSAVPVGSSAHIRFSAQVAPAGLVDGRRLVLVEAAGVREAVAAVESEAGAAAGTGVPATRWLDEDGRRVVLRPEAALRAFTAYALVLSSRVRAADGRPVLDPDGDRRTFVATFETGAPEGPPPVPVLTEVRADAATPEAGGEYVEIANLGQGPLDLGGHRLAKRTSAGALSSCAIVPPPGTIVPPGGVALVVGGAYDGRYALPSGVPVASCGATAILGGIANDRAPEILLADPLGTVIATLGARGGRVCAEALELIDPEGPDDPANLSCTGGSPGSIPGAWR